MADYLALGNSGLLKLGQGGGLLLDVQTDAPLVGGAGGRNWRDFVSGLPPQRRLQPYKKTRPEKIKVSVLVWDEDGGCSLVEMNEDEYLAFLI